MLQNYLPNMVLLLGQATAVLVRPRANQLAFDLESGKLIDHRRGDDLGLHMRISEAADPLHFGTLGGYGNPLYLVFVWRNAEYTLNLGRLYLWPEGNTELSGNRL